MIVYTGYEQLEMAIGRCYL